MIDEESELHALRVALAAARRREAVLAADLLAARQELQHRVRNTLAIVRSIARRSAESVETVEDYQQHLDGRLAALGRVQAALVRAPGLGVDLGSLITDELSTVGSLPIGTIELSGPEIRLKAKPAELIGLAVHELATNAVKFGALAAAAGRIAIGWSLDRQGGAPGILIAWREQCDVPLVAAGRRGFGTELLENAIAYELSGTTSLDYRREGLACQIRLPLDCRMSA
ncbi:sensor histidine kinase [Sphingomonas morindae]|uniref:histidine kinase n=1 Tax=Sphingomonas morindae TaxID=1541170 RepID=A0ABY4X5B4_9SPHN|nr:sensor histidine kinase [Sphingomonas morindae]USI72089.1 sensor histidine kinase [Sphingomonas morindae]